MSSKKYQAILFDVGGTLLTRTLADYTVLMERCKKINLLLDESTAKLASSCSEFWIGEQILREIHGAPRMTDQDFKRNIDYAALKAVLVNINSDDLWDMVLNLDSIAGPEQEWILIDGVDRALDSLLKKGFTLGVASNFDPSLPDLLMRHGLSKFFKCVVVSSLVGVEKPDPGILKIACDALEVAPEVCLYVGDHPFDVLCARGAGMDVAWITEERAVLPDHLKHKPDFRFASVVALNDWIGSQESQV